MTAITINIPNHEVSFFKKMIAKMGWTYSDADVVRTAATPKAAGKREQSQARLSSAERKQARPKSKEQALAKVDHALGQLRQMKDGQLQGINAEELLNEL